MDRGEFGPREPLTVAQREALERNTDFVYKDGLKKVIDRFYDDQISRHFQAVINSKVSTDDLEQILAYAGAKLSNGLFAFRRAGIGLEVVKVDENGQQVGPSFPLASECGNDQLIGPRRVDILYPGVTETMLQRARELEDQQAKTGLVID